MRLFYLVDNYPHDSTEFFPHLEYPYLRAAFPEVVLVTREPPDPAKTFAYPVPEGAKLRVDVAERTREILGRRGAVRARFPRTHPWRALAEFRRHGVAAWPDLAGQWVEAAVFMETLRERLRPTASDVLYSFWLNPLVAYASWRRICGTVAARAHGYDLYWERWGGRPPPFQSLAMRGTEVYPCSRQGEAYLREKYPRARVRASYLGVERRDVLARASADGIFRIVTCGNLIPLKRLDRLASALARVRRAVHWTHLGAGPMEPALRAAAAALPPRARATFAGRIDNAAVHRFYEREPVDLFVNLSSTEGVSVAIMEALSHGIPCLATAVGGTPELLEEANLLRADFTDAELARRIDAASPDAPRAAIRARQVERFDAATNFGAFAAELRALAARRSG